VIVACNLWWY